MAQTWRDMTTADLEIHLASFVREIRTFREIGVSAGARPRWVREIRRELARRATARPLMLAALEQAATAFGAAR